MREEKRGMRIKRAVGGQITKSSLVSSFRILALIEGLYPDESPYHELLLLQWRVDITWN